MNNMSRWSPYLIGIGIAAALMATPVAATNPSDDSPTGIKVHGHWVIEVSNADGTVSSRDEFDNALINPYVLTALLGRAGTAGFWMIALDSTVSNPCGAETPTPCNISQAGIQGLPPGSFATLTASLQGTDVVVLKGQATATRAGNIDRVWTHLQLCPVTDTPQNPCPLGAFQFPPLTGKLLGAPVLIQPQQVIQVTVTISFS
jgi:hypothetical protein